MVPATAFLTRHWRIVTVAAVGAILAFLGSFLVDPTYTADTRLLIRGRDATFLTSTGQDLSSQPGVVDSTLAQSLASTYAGIATSRGVATTVVDELRLDEVEPRSGLLASAASAFAWVYRCGRALITSGFCADVDPREKAIQSVQEGTAVAPLGTNSGGSAGTTGSYVLDVQASGSTAQEARRVTDAVADALVDASRTRFTSDSTDNIARLTSLVTQAEADVAARGAALAAFQNEHGLTAADGQQALSAGTNESVRADLIAAQAAEADLKAQLSSIGAALRSTPKSETSSQSITTGRSTTELTGQAASSVYSQLVVQQNTLQAQLEGQTARVTQLQATLDGNTELAGNSALAELSALQNAVSLAEKNLTDLSGTLRDAQVTQAQGPVDLTRIDQAAAPSYPSEPKRYVYLGLGLLLGGLAGVGLTAQARRRGAAGTGAPDDDDADADADDVAWGQGDPDDAELDATIFGEREPEPATNGRVGPAHTTNGRVGSAHTTNGLVGPDRAAPRRRDDG